MIKQYDRCNKCRKLDKLVFIRGERGKNGEILIAGICSNCSTKQAEDKLMKVLKGGDEE